MKYRVYYWDEPQKEVVVEASDHRSAAKEFFSQRPRIERCRIRVNPKSFFTNVQDFDAMDFMDEAARASIPPLAPAAASAVTAPASSRTSRPEEMRVVITDVNMRFSSMIVFMVKWAFAAIPAIIIIYVIVAIIVAVGIGLFGHR
jgi:hypothetical protein